GSRGWRGHSGYGQFRQTDAERRDAATGSTAARRSGGRGRPRRAAGGQNPVGARANVSAESVPATTWRNGVGRRSRFVAVAAHAEGPSATRPGQDGPVTTSHPRGPSLGADPTGRGLTTRRVGVPANGGDA